MIQCAVIIRGKKEIQYSTKLQTFSYSSTVFGMFNFFLFMHSCNSSSCTT